MRALVSRRHDNMSRRVAKGQHKKKQKKNTYRVSGARVLLNRDHQLARVFLFLSGSHGCGRCGVVWWASAALGGVGAEEAAEGAVFLAVGGQVGLM
jgi:hypothetical protein